MSNTVNFTIIVAGDVNDHILGECDVRQIRSISTDNLFKNGVKKESFTLLKPLRLFFSFGSSIGNYY